MRNYEVVVIALPELDEASFKGLIEKVSGWITEAGGTVNKTDIWGKQRMAYAINKQREAQYFMLSVTMPTQAAPQLERNLHLVEQVMRYMISAR